jgi:4-hydroxy-3-polyprenylbenzoate decarboxylase
VHDVDRSIVDVNLVHDALLLVKASGQGREVIRKLVVHPALAGIAVIAVVSDDVNIRDRENYLWGVFTRFDAERDIIFTHQELIGISPVYKGVLGIDATWKSGYPKPLAMNDTVVKKVDGMWGNIWK